MHCDYGWRVNWPPAALDRNWFTSFKCPVHLDLMLEIDRPPLLPSSSIRRVVVVGGHCLCPPLFFPGAMEWWLWFVYSPVQLHSHHRQKSLPRIETAQVLEQYNYIQLYSWEEEAEVLTPLHSLPSCLCDVMDNAVGRKMHTTRSGSD